MTKIAQLFVLQIVFLLVVGCKTVVEVQGKGSVTSTSTQIDNCIPAINDGGIAPSNCVATYTEPFTDTLTATPDPGWAFVKWDAVKLDETFQDNCFDSTINTCDRHVTNQILEGASGDTLRIGAIFEPILETQHTEYWEEVFRAPAPSPTARWTGGDHVSSFELPFCPTCPQGKRFRRLWLFGDSLSTTVDSSGNREENPDYKIIYGNSSAITYHGQNTSYSQISQVDFDWGAQGTPAIDQNAWLPTFQPANIYDALHPYNRRVRGFAEDGSTDYFDTTRDIAQAYERQQIAEGPVILTQPVYEYYNDSLSLSDYRLNQLIPDDGAGGEYRGIAFHTLKSQVPGSVSLYRYLSGFNTVVLSLTPNLNAPPNNFAFDPPVNLGYVFPANTVKANAFPVTQFYSNTAVHHNYFLRQEKKKTLARAYGPGTLSPQNGGPIVPVYRYVKPNTDQYLYDLSNNTSINDGYNNNGIAFMIHNAPVPDSVPLYQYFSTRDQTAILSTDAGLHLIHSGAMSDPDNHNFLPPGEPLGFVFPYVVNKSSKTNTVAIFQNVRGKKYGFAEADTKSPSGDNPARIATWPLQGISLSNDIVVTNRAIDAIDANTYPDLDTTLATVISDAHLPYEEWDKSLGGDWLIPPTQARIEISDDYTLWGISFLKEPTYDGVTNKFVYIYGSQRNALYGRNIVVARVEAATGADLINTDNWEFWNGNESTWEPVLDRHDATVITDPTPVSSQFSVAQNPNSSNFVMFHAEFVTKGTPGSIGTLIAPNPWGPFVPGPSFPISSSYHSSTDSNYRAGEFHGISLDGTHATISYIHTRAKEDKNVNVDYIPQFLSIPWASIEP